MICDMVAMGSGMKFNFILLPNGATEVRKLTEITDVLDLATMPKSIGGDAVSIRKDGTEDERCVCDVKHPTISAMLSGIEDELGRGGVGREGAGRGSTGRSKAKTRPLRKLWGAKLEAKAGEKMEKEKKATEDAVVGQVIDEEGRPAFEVVTTMEAAEVVDDEGNAVSCP